MLHFNVLMYVGVFTNVCLATNPFGSISATKRTPKFAFVTTTTPSIRRMQSHYGAANPSMQPLRYNKIAFDFFAQPSSVTSFESTNQTDSTVRDVNHYSRLSSPNDVVAMMTSRALEDEDDSLFLSLSAISSPQTPETHKITTNEENTPSFNLDVATPSGISTPSKQEQPTIHRSTMEPHVYYFNKALIDTVYNIICTLYPTTNGGTGSSDTKSTFLHNNKNDNKRGDGAKSTPKQISPQSYARFYVLETVARVPYFAYLSILHLRETLGERTYSSGSSGTLHDGEHSETNNSRIRTHYAEADNELHHLLIMESLGGNTNPIDRAVAHCMAVGYYWYVVMVYTLISPQAAYHLSELIEDHAYHTYDDFLNMYEHELKQLPVPPIAKQYYVDDNSYLMDLCRTTSSSNEQQQQQVVGGGGDDAAFRPTKPILNSLYDVFVCVRNDEKEHWKTLCQLVQNDRMSSTTTTTDGKDNSMVAASIQSTQPKKDM